MIFQIVDSPVISQDKATNLQYIQRLPNSIDQNRMRFSKFITCPMSISFVKILFYWENQSKYMTQIKRRRFLAARKLDFLLRTHTGNVIIMRYYTYYIN